ncbi:ARM repeat-containing protein [Fomitopsis serialis]|uniref:ARM repeat-containing protein n=1 Tax=Fomitopsis serialis TaxID=139415 RepID=UPI0020077A8B|nr:ARM repeat-containing protein [Neoantrodia serialis]KAH9937196.1 ARM repeat-containing protein [Neoantrodia serialis]
MAAVQAVLSALDVFSRAPDKAALDQANTWLQDFQHSRDSWSTCNVLLLSPDAPPAAKLFAAQTFRAKVTYDLHEMDPADVFRLRDTLVTALETYHAGPRTIMVQLCLAISGLALQLPSWEDPVQNMIDSFGRNPATVPALLHFLTILPEELCTNTKIPVTDDEYKERANQLLTSKAVAVVNLLSMYLQAPGVTSTIQAQIFACLSSWLAAGEVTAMSLVDSPLPGFAFDALVSDELFDSTVNVICDLIHETKRRGDVPQPLLHHPETFFPIVEAIGDCTAYQDLDIVPITFHFWMRLAQNIGKKPSVPSLLGRIQGTYGRHHPAPPLPEGSQHLTGQEAENFRSFRHVMGDTLKDCCYVLGADTCLLATYDMITAALARAPLFSMRSMGAEIDPTDDKAVPKIMDLIPSLPAHPRVRYAALLIISRYTQWINRHPDYIPYQLQYISAGFDDADTEVNAAAGQALKYMCEDCKQHLVDFLPQLHQFLATDDRLMVYEAIAHVISAMPMEQAAQSLRTFSSDILAQVHAIAAKPTPATKDELQSVCNALESLEVMLGVIQTFESAQEGWSFFDPFIVKYGSDYAICERIHGDGPANIAIVLKRMSAAFEATGFSSYLWIVGKIIGRFGHDEDPALRAAFKEVFEHSSNKLVRLLQEKLQLAFRMHTDYLQMLLQMLDYAPDVFFPSPALPVAFQAALAALTVVHTDIIFAALDLIRGIPVVQKAGPELTSYLLSGMVGDFPEESASTVVTIFRQLAILWQQELLSWLPMILQQLPATAVPDQAKAQFLTDMNSAIQSAEYDRVKRAILALHRASRKARDRRRTAPFEA